MRLTGEKGPFTPDGPFLLRNKAGVWLMSLESAHKHLEVQHHRIASQISLISHLRNDGRIEESERACRMLEEMLDKQSRLYKELWRAQNETSG